MKKCLTLIILMMLFLTSCDNSPRYEDLQGHSIRLSQFHGNWLVLNYWASWCKSCYKEIPELNAFYKAHKKDGIRLMGVNYDLASLDVLKSLVKKFNIQFPVLTSDPAKQLGIDNVPGLPATFIIGPDGKVVKQLYGIQTRQSLEEALVMKLAQNGRFNEKYLRT